jgi:hypothetical protein
LKRICDPSNIIKEKQYINENENGDIMGLSIQDRKELDLLIRAAVKDPKTPLHLARKMVPWQGNVEEFAYGLMCGMILGSFLERFIEKNDREPDRDELTDLFSITMRNMPNLRKAIMNELESI